MNIRSTNKLRGVVLALAFVAIPSSSRGQTEESIPILIEQKIVQVDLKPENQDGIDWDLLKLYLKDEASTTGFFPLSERARNRLEFLPMKKNVPPDRVRNEDFERVEQTRVNEFCFGPIWEDTRNPQQIKEDTHFGSLRITKFKTVMDYLRTLGDAKVIFSRKWTTENKEQSMVSSHPEVTGKAAEYLLEGSRLIIKATVIENRWISFHLDSEIAISFYVDPLTYPELPLVTIDAKKMAKLWRLYRLSTNGIVESGETAVFEDIREGKGVLLFITPYILESHRKILRD